MKLESRRWVTVRQYSADGFILFPASETNGGVFQGGVAGEALEIIGFHLAHIDDEQFLQRRRLRQRAKIIDALQGLAVNPSQPGSADASPEDDPHSAGLAVSETATSRPS